MLFSQLACDCPCIGKDPVGDFCALQHKISERKHMEKNKFKQEKNKTKQNSKNKEGNKEFLRYCVINTENMFPDVTRNIMRNCRCINGASVILFPQRH